MKYLLMLIALVLVMSGAGVLIGISPAKKMATKIVDTELKKSLPCKYKLGGIKSGFMRGVELQNRTFTTPRAEESSFTFIRCASRWGSAR
jgi:hypothetical protein